MQPLDRTELVKPQPYERLVAWQLTHALALESYQLTETFPRREWYSLGAQIRKAAFSVPCNIVEGSCKRGPAEFRKYLDIAWGSLGEYGYAVRFARDLALVGQEGWVGFFERWTEASKVTWALYAAVARRVRSRTT